MKQALLVLIFISVATFSFGQSYYAHIENGIVISVEVVTDEYFNANPQRYSGTWKKVGTANQNQSPECSKGDVYLQSKDKIIERKPFESWTLDEDKGEWKAPKAKPGDNFYWDEKKQDWIQSSK